MKKFLFILLSLLLLFYGFAMACIFNPDLTTAVAGILYPDRGTGGQIAAAETVPDTPDPDLYDDRDSDGGRPDIEPSGNGAFDWSPDEVQATGQPSEEFSGESENEGMEEGIASDYIPPEESELVIPENVSGKNGYQQIQDDREQIDDADAEQLRNQLDTGYIGDGLEFDELYYPYYAMLNEKGKHLYRQIYANGNELYQAFAPVESVTAGELRNIFSAVYNDHPELFWMETAYSGKYVRSGQCVEIDLRFNRTARDLESAKARFDDNAGQILSEAQNLSSDYDKEKFVHDALIGRIAYNMGAEMNQSAYSALVNDQTVCAGYARAFQYLMQQLGIPCYYCTGFAGESHAWNIIRLDDGFYNVDTTWDDTGDGTYDYFNKTDTDYASSHIRRDLSVYLPPCNGQEYRNLERADSNLRSLEDTGLTADQVFTDLEGYYADCYDQMLQNGRGRYSFYNILEGDMLVEQWYRDYQYNRFRQAYMEDAMTQIDAASCEITLEVEELQGGRYLIRHELYVR